MQYPAEAFETLGIASDSAPEEILHAYRRLARKYHPLVSEDTDAQARFKEVQLAYVVLKEFGAAGRDMPLASPDGVQYTVELDFTALTKQTGAALLNDEIKVDLTLEEAAQGTQVEVTAKVAERDPVMKHVRTVERTMPVRVPGNLVDGERLCVPGLASLGAGDLYITIRLKKHRHFHVNGADLFMKYPIAPWEAVLGSILDIPTLQGVVQVTLKPGLGTGQKLRLQGRGLPKATGGNGDLYCVLRVVTPRKVGERERELYRELSEVSKFRARETLGL
jgi:curved DNA-binding protein